MLITIQEIDGPNQPAGKKYKTLTVVFTKQDGSNSKKPLFSFGDGKPVYDRLAKGEFGPGDTVEVTAKKNGEYWDWVDIKPANPNDTPQPATKGGGKSTWVPDVNRETPKERYLKNLAICRQNALTNAVNSLSGTKATVEDIISRADNFFHYTTCDFIESNDLAKAVENTDQPTIK